jgi:hypothetical protein
VVSEKLNEEFDEDVLHTTDNAKKKIRARAKLLNRPHIRGIVK